MDKKDILEKYMCPGCVCGSNTKCGHYAPDESYGLSCSNHACGTSIGLRYKFALGMPKGFNQCQRRPGEMAADSKLLIRVWGKGEQPNWDERNVPVWALEHEGMLFVRTVAPRIGRVDVDIVQGGTLASVPQALDVAKFIDEID